MKRIRANKGAAGVDGLDIDQTAATLKTHWPAIRDCLLKGTYRPQRVRRVMIPKPSMGGRSSSGPTPQGGPLLPLLANLLLDEVDKELERRGHAFCRYADDCNVMCGPGGQGSG